MIIKDDLEVKTNDEMISKNINLIKSLGVTGCDKTPILKRANISTIFYRNVFTPVQFDTLKKCVEQIQAISASKTYTQLVLSFMCEKYDNKKHTPFYVWEKCNKCNLNLCLKISSVKDLVELCGGYAGYTRKNYVFEILRDIEREDEKLYNSCLVYNKWESLELSKKVRKEICELLNESENISPICENCYAKLKEQAKAIFRENEIEATIIREEQKRGLEIKWKEQEEKREQEQARQEEKRKIVETKKERAYIQKEQEKEKIYKMINGESLDEKTFKEIFLNVKTGKIIDKAIVSILKDYGSATIFIDYFNKIIDEIPSIADYIKNNFSRESIRNTCYWKLISRKKRQDNDYKCEECGSNYYVDTYKINDEINGDEHKDYVMDEELECLCYKCKSNKKAV